MTAPDSLPFVAPQRRGFVPTVEEQRVRAAVIGAAEAEKELHAAVVAALIAGGSVREVARVSGISVNTIERWGRAGGWPSKAQSAAWAKARADQQALRARQAEARRRLEEMDHE
ncbi:helix-turn-helix domain-containing protein [Rhodococcus fascians]|nr:helix-turn-helix domain-containing protein [Rhodococcus fascians]MBY4396870.1 helix-turn-helix domain-containing protein [Rhodococcus fascians]MBY4407349.1 helix-turn-helix domain-containing protein [Rhodococcus fascians]MBY4421522.1 helix-turn-helix domain-containing protein [Rhodococcus fascians]MBY4460725.1 helix-turn-helix domain-containing protein [Rhodococcus fascians]